jgi:hypothetical protein
VGARCHIPPSPVQLHRSSDRIFWHLESGASVVVTQVQLFLATSPSLLHKNLSFVLRFLRYHDEGKGRACYYCVLQYQWV